METRSLLSSLYKVWINTRPHFDAQTRCILLTVEYLSAYDAWMEFNHLLNPGSGHVSTVYVSGNEDSFTMNANGAALVAFPRCWFAEGDACTVHLSRQGADSASHLTGGWVKFYTSKVLVNTN